MNEPGPAPAPQEQPAPLLYFEGQPTTPAAAAQLRAELMGNKDFMKEALSGSDTAANQKMLALWQLSRGIQPPPAQTVEQVQQQTADRLERDRLTHVSALRSSAEFSDKAVEQIVGQRPIPIEEKRIAERRLAMLQKDQEFVKRYLAGDRQAALEFKAAAICARGMPVGTIEQINAWEAAHSAPAK